MIFIAVAGLFFLRSTIIRDGQRVKANLIVSDKVKIAEAHLATKQYDAAISILEEAYSIEFATNQNIARTCMNSIVLQIESDRLSAFKKWVEYRKYKDARTAAIYDSYFNAFLVILRAESVTPGHLKELAVIEQSFAVSGYNTFLEHFEIALLQIYNASNYGTDHESELCEVMRLRRIDIMEAIVNTVLASLPER